MSLSLSVVGAEDNTEDGSRVSGAPSSRYSDEKIALLQNSCKIDTVPISVDRLFDQRNIGVILPQSRGIHDSRSGFQFTPIHDELPQEYCQTARLNIALPEFNAFTLNISERRISVSETVPVMTLVQQIPRDDGRSFFIEYELLPTDRLVPDATAPGKYSIQSDVVVTPEVPMPNA